MAQDEGCFGRLSIPRRAWAPPGMRPHAPRQVVREYTYVYAAVAPAEGKMTSLILPSADTQMMELFLSHVSSTYANYFVVMQVDQASWHLSTELTIPENIRLIAQPAYSPELNPVEHVWEELREKQLSNLALSSLLKKSLPPSAGGRLSRLGHGLKLDVIAQPSQLTNQPFLNRLTLLFLKAGCSPFLVGGAFTQQVIDNHQDAVSHCHGGTLSSTPGGNVVKLCRQIAVLLACSGMSRLDPRVVATRDCLCGSFQRGVCQHSRGCPGTRLRRRARCPAVGNCCMLVPISAKIAQAARTLMPGMLQSNITAWAQLNVTFGAAAGTGWPSPGCWVCEASKPTSSSASAGGCGLASPSGCEDCPSSGGGRAHAPHNFGRHALDGLFQVLNLCQMFSRA